MFKIVSPITLFSALTLQSIRCLPNFLAVEEGGYHMDNVMRQMNAVPYGNQMMSQPVIRVPHYGIQHPAENHGYPPESLPTMHTAYNIPGPHPIPFHDQPGGVNHGYDLQPIQSNWHPVDPRLQAPVRPNPIQLNRGQVNGYNWRKQLIAEIGQNGPKIMQKIRKKVASKMEYTQLTASKSNLGPDHRLSQQGSQLSSATQAQLQEVHNAKSMRKGKQKLPLGVKKVSNKVSNRNKGKVLPNFNILPYDPMQSIPDVHEGIRPGFKPAINEVPKPKPTTPRTISTLYRLNANLQMLEGVPKSPEIQFMIEHLATSIQQIYGKPVKSTPGLVPGVPHPTVGDIVLYREKLIRTSQTRTKTYRELNAILDREKHAPVLVEGLRASPVESVGSSIARDELKPNEEVNSQPEAKDVGPSSNHDAEDKKPRRIPTFDLNKMPFEGQEIIDVD